MNPDKTARMIARYEAGILSSIEVSNSLLYDLLLEPEIDMALLSTVESLPQEVKNAFLRLIRSIEEADFYWIPLLLSVPKGATVPPADPAKLRRICALVLGRSQRGLSD